MRILGFSEDEGDSAGSGASDLIGDNLEEQLDVDIEAFPMEAGDKDGIVNMLTQVRFFPVSGASSSLVFRFCKDWLQF
ncbi:unnamed protein product [Cylicostephanus goldi]|uniref:Uncharacterized protein n=1 Tax=Cylicostephanus goldi TaxID=71465 RepID=A0A3P6RYV3_CYLGO|nr:unnamed protein product [Cylicostephanus goldi]